MQHADDSTPPRPPSVQGNGDRDGAGGAAPGYAPMAAVPAPPSATAEPAVPTPAATHAAAAHGEESHHMPVHALPGTGMRVALFAAALAVVLGAAFWFVHHRGQKDNDQQEADLRENLDHPADVDVVRVSRASTARVLSLQGEARPFYETTIFARVSGYLNQWKHDIGDRVDEGETLATIETPELDAQLTESNAKVDALRADVRLAESAVNFAQVSFERWDTAGAGVVSKQERDEKKAELDSAQAKLASAQAQLALGQADVQRLESMEKFKTVRAPFAGTITQRHIDIGALITAGSTASTTPLFNIAQFDKVRVFTDVPQVATPDIKPHMVVTTTAEECPGRTFVGEVERTAEMIDPRTRTLKVEALVDNPDHALLPGMYVQVSFESRRSAPPLRIPAAALVMRPDGPAAAVVADDGTVTFHKITIARDLGDQIEVGTGLADRDVVALNISHEISDGDRVTPHGAAAEPAKPTRTAQGLAPATTGVIGPEAAATK